MRSLLAVVAIALASVVAWFALKPAPPPRAATRAVAVEAPAPPTVPEPARQPETKITPRIVGKVTGDVPLAGVRIDATWEGGGASGATEEKGEYAIDVVPPARAVEAKLVAEAPDGRVGVGHGWVDPAKEENRQSDLALRAAAGVLLVTEPRVAAALELSLTVEQHGFPFPTPLPLLHTDGSGEVRARLPVGKYELIARAEGFGRTRIAFEVAEGTREVRVPLAQERRLKVLVRSKADGRWVEGARLRLYQSLQEYGTPEAFTDEVGAAVLRGLNREDKLMLDVVEPGEVPQVEERGPSARRRHAVPADVDEMLVEIDPARAISWVIEQGDIPAPPEGTVIPLRASAGTMVTPPAQGVMRGGRLCTEGWPPMAAHADALGPERTVARLFCALDSNEGMPTRFVRACNVTVVVRQPDGEPAPGVTVGIFNQGNNPMAKAATDGDGVAKLEMLDGQLAELYVLGSSDYDRKEQIGTVDLRKGDLLIEHTLMGRRRVEIRVVVDGQPALPEGRQLSLGSPLEQFVADAEQGLMSGLLPIRPNAVKLTAWFSAPGYLREMAEIRVPPGDEPIRHTFMLRPGIDLRVYEVGKAPERFDFELEKQEGVHWQPKDSKRVMPRPTRRPTGDGWIYPGLDPGAYRMRTPGGAVFGPATLAAGGPAAEIILDYTKVATIRGRVEMPEGGRFNEAYLMLEGDGIASDAFNPMWSSAIRPNYKDGTFEVFIPGDRKVKLSVRHPKFAPDPKRGQIETVAGAEGVVLALVPGPSLRFRIPEYFVKYAARFEKYPKWQRPFVEVRLYRGEISGLAEFTVFAQAEDREWKGAGFPPGTYSLWIALPEALPVVRRGVRLEEADTDLGELPMDPGSTLRIRVLVREPLVVPRINVWAQRLDEPRYYRGLNSDGESLVLVSGLAAGRYTVTGGVTMQMGMGPGRMLNEEIEFDGATDVERTLDLR